MIREYLQEVFAQRVQYETYLATFHNRNRIRDADIFVRILFRKSFE